MPAWDSNLLMLAIAYLTFFVGVVGWAVYARGRMRAVASDLARRTAAGSEPPGGKD